MKPGHTRLMWLAFAAAVAVVLAAMGWTTQAVVRLDAAEAESRRRARLEENARLALWRMDSALAPLIAAEHARPASMYAPRERGPGGSSPVFDPPPLPDAGDGAPFARLYFQLRPGAVPTSPQGQARQQLTALLGFAPRERLVAALPPGEAPQPEDYAAQVPEAVATTKGGKQEQAMRNAAEFGARGGINRMQQRVYAGNLSQQAMPEAAQGAAPGASSGGVMTPVWVGNELILARRSPAYGGGAAGDDAVQGLWVDWPAVRRWLLRSSADLLPGADLVPLHPGGSDPDARMLASLPVRLVPGELPAAPGEAAPSPLRASLMVAWSCVLLAVAAVAVLLRGVVSLSERRGAFVSAVTHELRTPLTTLRMYTEMLEGGMVADEAKRQSYLSTLRAEADRLGHLVENVLAYSRLERNRAGYEPVVVRLGDVLPRIVDRLSERARQAGMELAADVPGHVAERSVRANPLALEQILFNLVDNACKYAGRATDRRIELTAAVEGDHVTLRIRDHGPGIGTERSAKLFRPFSKSVQDAANTAPGLGLGLALSRRLAQSMGGSLTVAPVDRGAAFALSLASVPAGA